jgi:hypothetical protein
MKGGINFTEPLPRNYRRDTNTDIQTDGFSEVRRSDGLRCHDTYTNFQKIGSGIQKLIGEHFPDGIYENHKKPQSG